MSDLGERLARLGLSQYFEAFAAEGFDTWETVLDITESDLSHLNVKLGHRRKIQRAIAESRGQSADRPLPISLGRANSGEGSYRSDDSGAEGKGKQGEPSAPAAGAPGTKRKYRRHPKPDEHAPERPPSAYVIFSNHVRESLKGQDLTFTEIAKVVGEKWQILPANEREGCERQANAAKEKYYAELAEYKKTPQYEAYQKYLEEFRQKHAAPTKEGKRSKLETETSTSTRSSSHDHHERANARRMSSAQPETSSMAYHRPEPSPPIGPTRVPPGAPYTSKPTSPATRSLPGMQSPRMGEYYPPVSASPRSSTLQKELVHDMATTNIGRDVRTASDGSVPYQSLAYPDPTRQPASTTPPSYPFATHYQGQSDPSSRRPVRDSPRLPPLTHEDTTLSSESSHSGYGPPSTTGYHIQAPPPGSVKTLRILPQPVPSIGPSPSPLDRPPPPAPAPQLHQQSHDYRNQGPLAVLLRAGELASKSTDDDSQARDSLS